MTLANNYNPIRQLANGVTTSFSFNYDMINSDYATVYQEIDGVQTIVDPELYTIEFDDNGGNIVFKTAPTAGVYIVIGRDVPTNQETPYRTSSGFPANRVEENLDKLTAITQQLTNESNRSPKTPIGLTGIDMNLPAPSAGKALVWNQNANALTNSIINIDNTIEEITAQADRAENKANEAASSENAAASSASIAAESEKSAVQSAASALASAEEAKQYMENASFGNIGDVKYTLRSDVPNGGVWCDGSLYTKVQFPDVYQMLADNNIHSIPITDFDAQVSAYGSCGVFGFDASSETFKVPRLENVYIKSGMAPNSFNAESLQNITGNIGNTISSQAGETSSGALYQSFINSGGESRGNYKNIGIGFDASRSSNVYQNDAKVNPNHVTYRAYVVLYSAAAEESVAAVAGLIDELSRRKLLAYEGLRVIDCLGDVTVQLYDNDEIIRLTINGQSNITFDTSTLNFTKPYYTVQVRFIFPNGVQTVSLQTNEQYGLQWINQSVPDFSSGKTHWIVLRKEISYMFLEASDAGEGF